MPLLTMAVANVPAADAGLGSGITNVSQQVSGALGLAVLGTVATNHTKTLLGQHHALTSSLISGYHVAYLIAAVVIGTGILLALLVLRPGGARPAVHLSRATAPTSDGPADVEIERQAA
jgi:hypothetical protein